jgi:cardiolipin synthase
MVRALRNAARRGVDVKLVLPSVIDHSLVYYAGRSYYNSLLESGVKIYERRGSILHAKTAVIDRVWSTIGSTNMDLWSFLRNEEVNAIILGADFAEEMETLFVKDLENSDEITLEEWKERPFSDRLYEGFSRLLRYWL